MEDGEQLQEYYESGLNTFETISEPCVESGCVDALPSLSVSQQSPQLDTLDVNANYQHGGRFDPGHLPSTLCGVRTIDLMQGEMSKHTHVEDNVLEDEDRVAPSTIMDELKYLSQLESQPTLSRCMPEGVESANEENRLPDIAKPRKQGMKSIGIQLPSLEPRFFPHKPSVRKPTPLRMSPKKHNMVLPVIQQEMYDETQNRLRAARLHHRPQPLGKLAGLPGILQMRIKAKERVKERERERDEREKGKRKGLGEDREEDTLAIPVLGALHVPAHLLGRGRNRSLGRPNPILREETTRMRRYRSLMRLRRGLNLLN
jgi:hypothetical protein